VWKDNAMPDLLVELFSEEIPARMQARAAEDLRARMTDGLVAAGLTYAGAAGFVTPRRLVLAVEGLTASSPNLREERRGPKVGAPDAAVDGFARGAGVTRDQLEQRDDKKGPVYFAVIDVPGQPAAAIVAEVLGDVIRNFPWPKSMRWGAGSLRWVRPLHSVLCILTDEAGAQVVPFEIEGISAGAVTRGHRFLSPDAFSVVSFEDYEAKLKRAHVVLSTQERADAIWTEATSQAFARGLELVEDKALLAEVAGLVEWPVVLMGEIDAAFLNLPAEVLQTSMREHQKFFSVRNGKTGRIERFVTVANTDPADGGATILAGNQKVLAARLSDAKFFWNNDLRAVIDAGLEAWTEQLSNVTFHNKLGSQRDRITRIEALAREIADVTGADPDVAAQAARVAKADLSSEMVYEFPELQGLMGRYYSEAAGLPAEVAAACQEHYAPLGPSDNVPVAPVSVAVALADKLDTLTGFWAIDEKPTGSKDPFALRRAALGVIRLVLVNGLRVGLSDVSKGIFEAQVKNLWIGGVVFGEDDPEGPYRQLEKVYPDWEKRSTDSIEPAAYEDAMWSDFEGEWSVAVIKSLSSEKAETLLSFFHDRLKVYLRTDGIRHDVIDACIAMHGSDDLWLVNARARAVQAILETEDGSNLLQGFKRSNNILTQAEDKDGVEYSYGADIKYADDATEKALFSALKDAKPRIAEALKQEDFAAATKAMAALRGPVDGFFEAVKINDDRQVVRRNRLNLLAEVRNLCGQVADLTLIEG